MPATTQLPEKGLPVSTHDGRRRVTVGRLMPDGTFLRRCQPNHILRVPPAIALQADALSFLKRHGCKRIVVDVEGGRSYRASFETFESYAIRINRQFGEQLALPLDRWDNPGQGNLL